jgi:UDP-N-acetylmuramoylalanine--D-glutamate ligase
VAHRLQLVSEAKGARWYDDSIATAPERLMAALRCFDQPVILLVGGRDKHLPWDEAAEMMARQCKRVILFGEMGPLVQSHLQKDTPAVLVNTLREAVEAAANVAEPGDVVLLSPGGTSYDSFKDFAERGDYFRKEITNYELRIESVTLRI